MPALHRVLAGYSRAAEHARLWLLHAGAAALLDRRRRTDWLAAGAAITAAEAVKRIARRERPRLSGLPPFAATPGSTPTGSENALASDSIAMPGTR